MHEALRNIRNKVPWLSAEPEELPAPPAPPTPLEEAVRLTILAQGPGRIDTGSPTWGAVSKWAAQELILAQRKLETATDEKAAGLRARAQTLRDVLSMHEQRAVELIPDTGPFVP